MPSGKCTKKSYCEQVNRQHFHIWNSHHQHAPWLFQTMLYDRLFLSNSWTACQPAGLGLTMLFFTQLLSYKHVDHNKPVGNGGEVRQKFVEDRIKPMQMHALLSRNKLLPQPNKVLFIHPFGFRQSKQLHVANEVRVYFQLTVGRLPGHVIVYNLDTEVNQHSTVT